MDELTFYDGAYTGPQIDAAIRKITVIPAATYTLGGVSFTFRKFGRVIIVTTSGSNTSQLATNALLGTEAAISDDLLPLATEIRYFPVTGTVNAQFSLSAAGEFKVGYPSATMPANTTWRGTISYFSAS